MSEAGRASGVETAPGRRATGLVDCDVHNTVPAARLPRELPARWRRCYEDVGLLHPNTGTIMSVPGARGRVLGNTGHAFVVLDVEAFMPAPRYAERVAGLVAEIRAAPLAAGAERVLLPGELEAEAERAALRRGLDLDAPTWSGLEELAAALDLRRELRACRR